MESVFWPYREIAQVMYFAAEDGCCIRWYYDFSRHWGIEKRQARTARQHFYGTINITEARFARHYATWNENYTANVFLTLPKHAPKLSLEYSEMYKELCNRPSKIAQEFESNCWKWKQLCLCTAWKCCKFLSPHPWHPSSIDTCLQHKRSTELLTCQ